MMLGKYELNDVYVTECVEGMKQLPDNCVDLTITSPPYDKLRKYSKDKKVNNSFNLKQTVEQLFRITKQGGVVVWIVNDQTIKGSETGTSFRQALSFLEYGFNLHDTMIYAKKNYLPLNHNRYENQFEYMFVFSKGKPKTFNPIMEECLHAGKINKGTIRKKVGSNAENSDELFQKNGYGKPVKNKKMRSNIWFYSVGTASSSDSYASQHPAIFPENLALDHILSWSNEDDVIFDPFVGSGTTMKMAKKEKRQYIGFDKSEQYIEKISKKRLKFS